MRLRDKSILDISDVFDVIRKLNIKHGILRIRTGQEIYVGRSICRMARMRLPLECVMCGCCATHLQREINEKNGQVTWDIKAWNKQFEKPTKLTIDHIIPKKYGGTLHSPNMRILCESCNSRRGHKIKYTDLGPIDETYYYNFNLVLKQLKKDLPLGDVTEVRKLCHEFLQRLNQRPKYVTSRRVIEHLIFLVLNKSSISVKKTYVDNLISMVRRENESVFK